MIDRHRFDLLTGRLYNRRIVFRDGLRKDKHFFIRLYTFTEISELLRQVGLEVEQVFGGWDGEPLSLEKRKMVIIARK
jgi:hypothetical protein